MSSTASPRACSAALAQSAALLAAGGIAAPAAEARLMLTHVCGAEPILAPPLSAADEDRLAGLIARRLAGEPLQHVLGEMAFRYLVLASDARALVARPETELVAGAAIEELRARPRPSRVLDLGTGSGAIAIAIATEVAAVRVRAVDIDRDALGLARENAARYAAAIAAAGAELVIEEADLRTVSGAGYDVVVANPPYIPAGAPLPGDVLRDPGRALCGGGGAGLHLPEAVIATAGRVLAPGGLLVLEHHETQGAHLAAAARRAGFAATRVNLDLAGRERYLTARMCTGSADRGRIAT